MKLSTSRYLHSWICILSLCISANSVAEEPTIRDVCFLSESTLAVNYTIRDAVGRLALYDCIGKRIDYYPFPTSGVVTFVDGSSERLSAWRGIGEIEGQKVMDYYISSDCGMNVVRLDGLSGLPPGEKLIVCLLPPEQYIVAARSETRGEYEYSLYETGRGILSRGATAPHSGDFFPMACASREVDGRQFLIVVERGIGKNLTNIRLISVSSSLLLQENDHQQRAGVPVQLAPISSSSLVLLQHKPNCLLLVDISDHAGEYRLEIGPLYSEFFDEATSAQVSEELLVTGTRKLGEMRGLRIDSLLQEGEGASSANWRCPPSSEGGSWLLSPKGSKIVYWGDGISGLDIYGIQYPGIVQLVTVNVEGANE